ncbi:MAG: hypothetical protein ACPG6R_11000 [Aequoribacter sp.]|uniref:hypothetical protein n=1 Tax=Aequoribacter sp. TaxID=2847771 RepID=UPI003C41A593
MTQEILEDTTQELLVYPPAEFDFAPSSATVRVQTPAQGMQSSDDAEAMTVDSVSASTNAAASAGDTSLSFASDPTATVGRAYLLVDATTGEKIHVECRKSGATFYLANPLPIDIASGSVLDGLAMTHALTTTETRDAGNGLAIVNAMINGIEVEFFHQFLVVGRGTAYTLTGAKLVELYPDIVRHKPSNEGGWTEVIKAAWVKYVRPSLLTRGYRTERIVSWGDLEPWHAAACMWHAIGLNPASDPEDRDRVKDEMKMLAGNTLQSVNFWYDGGANAGPDEAPEEPRVLTTMIGR